MRRRREEKTGVEVGTGCTGGVLSCFVSYLHKGARADGVMLGEMRFVLGVGLLSFLLQNTSLACLMPISLLAC